MSKSAEDRDVKYKPELDLSREKELGDRPENMNPLFRAGQSNRVWGELYKVIDSSDVVVQVVDARDPMVRKLDKLEIFHRNKGYEANFKPFIEVSNFLRFYQIFKYSTQKFQKLRHS